ncbi:MAG TPA: hypothetical protein VLM38_19725 [Blastocatellia bacterium]|nr:hypothetical protein [Blastocatellia bacterium]
MRKSLLIALLIFVVLSFAVLAGITDVTPVTTTIRDYVDVGDPYPLSTKRIPMQIQSDGNATYTNSSTLRSVIINAGGWDFDTGFTYIRRPTRRVYLDFSQPISKTGPGGTDPVPPFTTAFVRPWFSSKCYYNGVEMLAMGAGEIVTCGLTGNFANPADGVEYRIIMNPGCPAFSDGCPETNATTVTCTGVDGNGNCNIWTIEPSGPCVTADCSLRKNVIRLAKIATVKGKSVATNLGDFYMSFAIEVTNP